MIWPIVILGALGGVLGLGLAIASKVLHVELDNRVETVLQLLPGLNCGACGYPGCEGFAEGIVAGDVPKLSACKPGKAEAHFNPIIEFLKDNPNPDGTKINVKV